MLELDEMRIRQGDFVVGADVSLPSGRTAIIGPSGSGKSTLLGAVAGFIDVADGQIRWSGTDITQLDPSRRPVSMVFQDNNLFPHLSIAQNVALAVEPRLKVSARTSARVNEVLERVGLNGLGDRKPAALSGGQQSRAALARVLLSERPVVLLDEPFAALGPGLRQQMLDLVKELLSDRLILMVTHDPDDARTFAEQVIFMDNGVASEPVSTAQLFANPPEELKDYLGQK